MCENLINQNKYDLNLELFKNTLNSNSHDIFKDVILSKILYI